MEPSSPPISGKPRKGQPAGAVPSIGAPPSLAVQFSRIWRQGRRLLFRSQPRLTALYIIVTVLSSLAMMIVPQLFGEITNALQRAASLPAAETGSSPRQHLLWLFLAWAVVLLIARPLLNLTGKIITTRLDNRVGLDLGQQLFRKVLGKPLPFFHERDTGSLTYLLRDMCIQAQMAIRQLTLDPILMTVSLLTGLAFVVYNYFKISDGATTPGSWLVVSGLIALGLASPFLVSRLAPGLQMASREMRDRQAALASLLQGALQSPEEVQSFNAVTYIGDKHRQAQRLLNQTREAQTVAVEKINFFNSAPSDLTQVLLVGAAILIVFASRGIEHIGSLVAILLLVPQLMRPIQGLSSVIVSLKTSWPSIEAVLDIVESPDSTSLHTGSESVTGPDITTEENAFAIVASDLRFRYRSDLPPVFDGASFTIPRGCTATVVARMGQGKTTLFRLLLKFYRAKAGQLSVNGQNIDGIDTGDLRSRVALLSQFPAFTHDSVRDNLRIAAPEADDRQLLDTCQRTGMIDILRAKLDSSESSPTAILDTPFASGTILSGGQRRLFALTRCLLRDPEILLLDEPTTGLDNAEKRSLIPVLQKIFADKTVIIVDHDTRWIHSVCDHFIILEAGKTRQFSDREKVAGGSRLFAELLQEHSKPPL